METRRLLTLILLLAGASCAGNPATPEQAARLLAAGQLEQACQAYQRLLEPAGPREERLGRLKSWLQCLERSGRLSEGEAWLVRQPAGALTLYGEALLLAARRPEQLDRAIALLQRASALWPDQGELPYRAAVLLLADEQSQAALPLLERACRLTEDAACVLALGHALLDLDRAPEALEQARRAVLLSPGPEDLARGRALIQRVNRRAAATSPRARERLAALVAALQGDQPAAAVRLAQQLTADYPRLGQAFTLLGLAQLKLANTAEAVVALRQGSELSPLSAQNPLYLALIYQSRQQLDQAALHYRQALRLDPFNDHAARELGKLLLQQGRPGDAARVLDQARALDPEHPLTARLAARAHLSADDLPGAEALFAALSQKEPDDFEVHLRLGQLLLQRAQQPPRQLTLFERATAHARRAAASRPEDPEVKKLLQQLSAAQRPAAGAAPD